MSVNGASSSSSPTNYIAYSTSGSKRPHLGHLDQDAKQIHPLAHKSGTPLTNLYEAIEVGKENVIRSGDPVPLDEVTVLPPISGRDILAVGKNYSEHAKEFNKSGYDASDKVDQPTHPVIFTKRATSIIADGEEIYPHSEWTQTLDYEGEIGVIIGKAGHKITEHDAMNHVWGYTIINDVTAREKQRDHKQFYIGKSADTFCPIGPIAVPKEYLPKNLKVETVVNGEKRQSGTLEDLIFSIPYLVQILSESQTLQPGDTIATGTPAGVGFGFEPAKFLKAGDEVKVSVTGLGTLTNKIGDSRSINPSYARNKALSHIPLANDKALGSGLTLLGRKNLYYSKRGAENNKPLLFIHGLGGTSEYFSPILQHSSYKTRTSHLIDLEGHGLSPTLATSTLSIDSFARDFDAVCQHASLKSGVTLIAHSMGCLVAIKLALMNPDLVSHLILMGPPPSPLPAAGANGMHARAATARAKGMAGVTDAVVGAGTSQRTQSSKPLAVTAARLSLLGQDPEGYAKACDALGNSSEETLDVKGLKCKTLIITGTEDKVSPPALCEKYQGQIAKCEKPVVLENVGHWHLFEDPEGVIDACVKFTG